MVEQAAHAATAAAAIDSGNAKPRGPVIGADEMPTFLGPPRYIGDELHTAAEIGTVNGLAWTPYGGEVLHVEAQTMAGRGSLILTGQLGDVMKESAQAALSFARAYALNLGMSSEFYAGREIHIHVPAGGIPKDGPSAGVTMACALVSLIAGIPVRHDVAMTGELTLRGKVLPIGGLKEKLLAAARAGITTALIPAAERARAVRDPGPRHHQADRQAGPHDGRDPGDRAGGLAGRDEEGRVRAQARRARRRPPQARLPPRHRLTRSSSLSRLRERAGERASRLRSRSPPASPRKRFVQTANAFVPLSVAPPGLASVACVRRAGRPRLARRSRLARAVSSRRQGDLEDCYREQFAAVDRAIAPVLQGADRETAIHEVFARLMSGAELRLFLPGGSLAAWLATVARNHAIDVRRRLARETDALGRAESEADAPSANGPTQRTPGC